MVKHKYHKKIGKYYEGIIEKKSFNSIDEKQLLLKKEKPTMPLEQHKKQESIPLEKPQSYKEIIEEIKSKTDLKKYPFDEFWFETGFTWRNQTLKRIHERLKEEINEFCMKYAITEPILEKEITKIFEDTLKGTREGGLK